MTRRAPRGGPERVGHSRQALEARKFAAIGYLVSGIAHEINSPTQYISDNLRFLLNAFRQLTALLPADVLELGDGSPELAYLLDEIPSAVAQSLSGITQVSEVIDAVKCFAAARVGEVVMLDLNKALESVLTMAQNEWKYVAQVARDLDPELPLVPCEEAELKQMILRLVLDAARAIAAADAPGSITVATQHDGECVTMSVGDTGAAIPDKTLDQLGQEFCTFRMPLGASNRVRSLAFVRDVTTRWGGTIVVTSAVGQGTMVIVRLPLHAATASEHITATSAAAPSVSGLTKGDPDVGR